MKPQSAVASLAVIIVGAAGCAATPSQASPTDSPPTSSSTSGTVVRYRDVRTSTEFLDLGRRGGDPSPGDIFLFGGDLHHTDERARAPRRPVGHFLSTCTIIVGMQVKCSGSLVFPDGTIEIAGTPDFASTQPITAAVIGGTGRYNGVSGGVTITSIHDNVSRLDVRLDPPG